MTLRDKILRRLKNAGYEVTYTNFSDSYYIVTVKYQCNKPFHWSIFKGIDFGNCDGNINWDSKSVEDRIALKIPRENIVIVEMAQGDLPIFTRHFRKTYLLDSKSKIKVTRKRKSYHVRPIFLAPYYSLDYIIRNAEKTIKKYHLKKYQLQVFIHSLGLFGGFIGVGPYAN